MAFKAELLKAKLKEAGKTRAFLSEVTGRTERTVSRWLNNGPRPKDKDLQKIAEALGCDAREFDPSFAPESSDSVPVHAHVSVAAHNAFAVMNLRYGVSQREIIELAPVLFSMVAGYAMSIPQDDEEFEREAHQRGLGSSNYLIQPGEDGLTISDLDERAIQRNKCFGLPPQSEFGFSSRNFFYEAIKRLSRQIDGYVDTRHFVEPEAGKAPTALGFIPDINLFNNMTDGDVGLQDGLLRGQIRLSSLLAGLKAGKYKNINDFREDLRHNLKKEKEEFRKPLSHQRAVGEVQRNAWLTFYEERYPDLAREYDQLVATHCHEEGWYPIEYSDEQKEKFWTKPYLEERFIIESSFPELQRRRKAGLYADPIMDPTYRRLKKLEDHRTKLRHEFNPGDPDLPRVHEFVL
ncbi:Helix-turn-helix [Paracoccus halophilus]|uniref:Helix-turn-helix n=1 Tax=Paracoccus halophilus TaxID=376733 RepID=A0A099EUK4_9RHOB|nr:helix-turn-helix transcriptional regulator [Paracoccus halophilus]KGJ01681.1 hypothetical protein IT41_19500 [Paracoccus halophilus]SFA62697.1 Helix-turn-helix [Paracoccus halophilus]